MAEFFVDLDVATGAGTETGLVGNPIAADQFQQRIETGNYTLSPLLTAPANTDTYRLKGETTIDIRPYTEYCQKLSAWDLSTYGPYRFDFLTITTVTDINDMVANEDAKIQIASGATFRNCRIIQEIQFNGSGTTTFEGCTFESTYFMFTTSANSTTLTFTDCIVNSESIRSTTPPTGTTINFNNTAIKGPQSNFTHANITLNVSASTFDNAWVREKFITYDSPEKHFTAQAFPHSVTGSGSYTNYPTDMFGNTRTVIGAVTETTYTLEFYVDLDIATGTGTELGTSGSPLAANQFNQRVETGSNSLASSLDVTFSLDEYRLKGATTADIRPYLANCQKLSAWDLSTYGPYRFNSFTITTITDINDMVANGVNKIIIASGATFRNCRIIQEIQFTGAGTTTFEGCTLESPNILYTTSSSNTTLTFTDCIVNTESIRSTTPPSGTTINFNNTAIKGPQSNFTHANITLNVTASTFDNNWVREKFITYNSPEKHFTVQAFPHSVTGSGSYTNYPKDMFGNTRTVIGAVTETTYTLEFYVDLDIATGVGTETGLVGNPLAANQFDQRIETGSNSLAPSVDPTFSLDEYRIKGSSSLDIRPYLQYCQKLSAWDLSTYGPYRLENLTATSVPDINDLVATHAIDIDLNASLTFRNCRILKLLRNTGAYTITFEGCTFEGANMLSTSSSSNATFTFTDCIINADSFSTAPEPGTTINFNNTAIKGAQSNFEHANITLNQTASAFNHQWNSPQFVSFDSPEDHFAYNAFQTTVTGTGSYTDYPTDMFGNTRVHLGGVSEVAYEPEYYVDLDVATGAGTEDGTSGNPIAANQFAQRVSSGSGALSPLLDDPSGFDQYLAKGELSTSTNLYGAYSYKISAWELNPWRIQFTNNAAVVSTKILERGILATTPETNNMSVTGYPSLNSCFLRGVIIPSSDIIFNGSTVKSSEMKAGGDHYYTNCILDYATVEDAAYDVHMTNCATTLAQAAFDGTPALATNVGNQFDLVLAQALPVWNESDYTLFGVDENITINGSGTYTDYPTGLFGNPRTDYNEFMQGAGMGASFFPYQNTVDTAGSMEFTSIQSAISALPGLSTITGNTEVVIKAGEYTENLIITGNAIPGQRRIIRPISGDEHKGDVSSGVQIISSGSTHAVECRGKGVWVKDLVVRFTPAATRSIIFCSGTSSRAINTIGILESGSAGGYGVRLISGCLAYKCIMIDKSGVGSRGYYNNNGTEYVRNSVSVGFDRGFSGHAQYFRIYNSVAVNARTSCFGGIYLTGSNNAATDATTGLQLTLEQIDFVDFDNDDLHIGKYSSLLGAGADQSAYFTTDIDGETFEYWNIGVDFAPVYFTDFDQVASGTGSPFDPINANDWRLRITGSGGTGSFVDDYRIKGSYAAAVFNIYYFKSLEAWDLMQFGPWQISMSANDFYLGAFGDPGFSQVIRDAVVEAPRHTYMGYADLYNVNHISTDPSGYFLIGGSGKTTADFKGCTFTNIKQNTGSSRTYNLSNCILYEVGSFGSGDSTINSVNCVFVEADYATVLSNLNASGGTNTGCQFGFTPASAQPGYEEASYADYAVDANVTISGDGNYTDHPTGLFGNPRRSYNSATSGAGMGGSYLPYDVTVDAAGSREFTTIAAAIASIPTNMNEITGPAGVFVKSGTYSEGAIFPAFTNISSDAYVYMQAEAGSEHNGIFDAGVIVTGKVEIYSSYFTLTNIQTNDQILVGNYTPNDDVVVENCLVKMIAGTLDANGISCKTSGTATKIKKCIVWSPAALSNNYAFGSPSGVTLVDLYNCVAYGLFHAGCFRRHNSTTNCVAVNLDTTPIYPEFSLVNTSLNDLSTDGSANGFNYQLLSNIDWADPDNGDFTPAATSSLLKIGTNLSGEFTTDIKGDTITDWMIGAFWNNGVGHFEALIPVGSAKKYIDLQIAINSIVQRDLSGKGVAVVELDAETYTIGYNDPLGVQFSNASSSDYIHIRPVSGSEPKGIFGSGPIIPSIYLPSAFTKFSDIEVHNTAPSQLLVDLKAVKCNSLVFENILVKAQNASSGIFCRYNTLANSFYKCVIWDATNDGNTGLAGNSALDIIVAKNCISKGFATGFTHVETTNCTSVEARTTDFVSPVAGSDFNVSTGPSAPGANSIPNSPTIDADFVDASNGDFHVGLDSVYNRAGEDSSSDFTDDIDLIEIPTVKWPISIDYRDLPPVWENSTPIISNKVIGGVTVDAQIESAGTAYMVIVLSTASAPTPEEIKNGESAGGGTPVASDSVVLTPSTIGQMGATGLLVEDYSIYVVAENDWPTLQVDVVKIDLDLTPPPYTAGTPELINVDFDTVDVNVGLLENGTGYMVVGPDGDPAPSSIEVKNGQSSGGGVPTDSGNVSLTASVNGTINTTGLDQVIHDVYVTAEDTALNIRETPTKLVLNLEPPVFEVGFPRVNGFGVDTGDIGVQIDKDGDAYIVAVMSGDDAPSVEQVRAGEDSTGTPVPSGHSINGAVVADTERVFTLTNLTPGGMYDVYTVGDSYNIVPTTDSPVSVLLLLDSTPPEYAVGYPKLWNTVSNSTDVLTKTNEDGTVYIVMVASDSLPPSKAQIKSGLDGSGNPALDSAIDSLTANVETSSSLGNMEASTNYDVYVLAEDLSFNSLDAVRLNLSRSQYKVENSPIHVNVALSATSRTSMQTIAGGFYSIPGEWAVINNGRLEKVTTGAPGKMHSFPIKDIGGVFNTPLLRKGRISVLDTPGTRVTVNKRGYVEGIIHGDELVVSVEAGEEGKLKSVRNAAPGTYEVVAKCESLDNDKEIMVWNFISSSRYVTIY